MLNMNAEIVITPKAFDVGCDWKFSTGDRKE